MQRIWSRKARLLTSVKGKGKCHQERSEDRCLCEHRKCCRPWQAVLENDAGGIGLFRSEFLVSGEQQHYPTEEQQFAGIQDRLRRSMAGKKVIIRTLDIGADKQVDYFNLDKEENPATGIQSNPYLSDTDRKSSRRSYARFIVQQYYGNLSIMFPMIISVE